MRGLAERSTSEAVGEFCATAVSVCDWSSRHVTSWLQQIGMHRYVELFVSHNVDGQTLMALDSSKMKV